MQQLQNLQKVKLLTVNAQTEVEKLLDQAVAIHNDEKRSNLDILPIIAPLFDYLPFILNFMPDLKARVKAILEAILPELNELNSKLD